ncbi:MAG: rhodanese-like domain-containing protein [Phycisphaerales bacterium]|nr:rhodanese-like domain-containing protein [Phycisphaerales bacterium]
MAGSLVRIAVIVGVAGIGAFVHARMTSLPWRTDVPAVQRRLEIKDVVKTHRGNDGSSSEAANAGGKEGEPSLGYGRVSLDELRAAIDDPYVIIIDARPHTEFEAGHLSRSVTPTLNIDAERSFDDPRMSELMSSGLQFVLYCTSTDCDLAEQLYVAMTQMGFNGSQIRIFPPGWEGIEQAKLPTASGPDEWTGFGVPEAPEESAADPNQ